MGRGKGGYNNRQPYYKDTEGRKVTDKYTIFVAERYMDMGYEAVFRRTHEPDKGCDLTIKSSDDKKIIKDIEVKGIESDKPRSVADAFARARKQIKPGDTVAIYLVHHKNSKAALDFVKPGIAEAQRKGHIKGPVEIWFSDKTSTTINLEEFLADS